MRFECRQPLLNLRICQANRRTSDSCTGWTASPPPGSAGSAFSHAGWAAKPGYPGPGSWLHGGGLALMAQVQAHGPAGANVFRHDFGLCNAYAHGLEAAAAVQCPAHLVLGSADVMTPARATRELAQALRARVHTVPAGHALMQEQPDAVLAALRTACA